MKLPHLLFFVQCCILAFIWYSLRVVPTILSPEIVSVTLSHGARAKNGALLQEPPRPHSSTDSESHSITPNVLDETVRLILPPDEAHVYIRKYPGEDFRFYVYDLPDEYTWRHISKCIETKVWRNVSNCDWGRSVCTEVRSRNPLWSRRRFNRNGDVVIAKLLDEYTGPLKTKDPSRADLFVVPYPSTSNCECRKHTVRCPVAVSSNEIHDLVMNLSYYTPSTAHKHLFLASTDHTEMHPYFRNTEKVPLVTTIGPARGCDENFTSPCGQVVIPYVNTNPEYQPHALFHAPLHKRKYSLSAFMSTKIAGNSHDRMAFSKAMANISVLAGRPIAVTPLRGKRRTLQDERYVQSSYRDTIFCPCLRGDEPPQKRFIDALLAGCIPVVLSHPSRTKNVPSHFAPGTDGIHHVYPFANGIFHQHHNMGIVYDDLVVSINGSCGVSCLIPTLQDLLEHHEDVLLRKQESISRVTRLLSFALEGQSLQSPDAIAALLVQARHFVIQRSNE